MYFEIVDNKDAWNNFYRKLNNKDRDIYFTYDYCKLHEDNAIQKPLVALFEGDNGMILLYPFLLCEINTNYLNKKYYDIQSCYGYGGPCASKYNEDDIKCFEDLFIKWAYENNIVAEFIRFHPMIENHKYFYKNIKIEQNRETVFVDLEPELNEIWTKSITSKNRNMIKKAEKYELYAEKTKNYDEFLTLYYATMNRLSADKMYYFNQNYFKNLFSTENYFIINIKKDNNTIASGIFIYDNYYLNYHLAGSAEEYLNFAPNNFLLFNAIKFGKELEFSKLYLGGGRTTDENDSLFLFKKSFSSNLKTFYTGKRIINKDVYDLLISNWEIQNNKKAKLFLQYR